jgi:GxxExxY protein
MLNAKEGEGTQRENAIGAVVIDAALKVHTALGPGLPESAYEACLAHELAKRGRPVRRQVVQPVRYDNIVVEGGYRIDILVDDCVVIEAKAVEMLLPIHGTQLLSYLRFGDYRLGFLLNFHVLHMRDGIRRLANGL